ncbi:hypothetical protein A3H85_03305 [Candidatus Daviesbacteria bacterium RIFCSPLOWO2_02_FULL_40_8]|uniref:Glycosyltransferase RgtA/B/C/D-like domain-containing protein n=1 Tax=Candidatus Daviesbacteria bacterium RIFCSPLOWO2_01_FULL_40_24 TaxID=1797787 RepID=A0A1F5MIQ6_9BACT|nr:MAG: hypothetical protein A2780_03075 [Candidatus Daviesbacteria bacterium RIFCSPHIGHO2_01_FULL_41_45]OGE34111.1 MAG: hypothetical protein A3C32_00255 [Candidatus Daviesbacteria bacterium RIFCSPHIGHO2_02_FULL_41_14]OGE65267.1 MAG: hypothetical protein A3B49_02450 [Candidatus Daviesbacteria bacterium RIFCSPLOWO2_01_FULL_40_24]OGE66538.1 MAG: hypothetical protein A3H85_03305 [Candidatus Daviesbacteria bacterium RIFCSPLOWO2_02_FULL_40_8]
MSSFYRSNLILTIIIVLAFIFRVYGLNWDQGYHLHPDERMITMVTNKISWPNNLNPEFFAYGSLPIYLLAIAGNLAGLIDPLYSRYDQINLVGRFLSALFDTGTVLVLYLLTKLIFNKIAALLASLFYAISVLPIQLSHFYAVDTPLTFFITVCLYLLVKYRWSNHLRYLYFGGVSLGLALATKTSALILFVPLLISIPLHLNRHKIYKSVVSLVATLLLIFITFAISEPFALIDFATFFRQTMEQQVMTKDAFVFPYTLQYVGKVSYLYELKNILWGLGPILSVLSLSGILYITIYSVFKKRWLILIPVTFFWIYFLVVGGFAVGFMRYMLPLYPLFCLSAGFLLFELYEVIKQYLPKSLFIMLSSLIIALLLVWPLSFLQIYSTDNTRVTATKWINSQIPQTAVIAREHWDDELPTDNFGRYQSLELPMYEPDTPAKWDRVNNILGQADYLIIASNRLYVPLMKLTNCQTLPTSRCYRQSADYYQKLFNQQLDYTKVAEFSSYPKIPFTNLAINDFDADESFTVYDHPKIMIFKNEKLSQ